MDPGSLSRIVGLILSANLTSEPPADARRNVAPDGLVDDPLADSAQDRVLRRPDMSAAGEGQPTPSAVRMANPDRPPQRFVSRSCAREAVQM